MYESIPYRTNTYPQALATMLNSKYCKNKLDLIFKHSNVHKLTYKGLDLEMKDSVYHFMLSDMTKRSNLQSE